MFNKKTVINRLNNNIFTLPQYSVSVDMYDMFITLARFMNREKYRGMDNNTDAFSTTGAYKEFADLTISCVPEFQRDNDKWTKEMQSGYLTNCLMGMKSMPIILYSIDGTKNNCLILDGLQRLTAFYDFIISRTVMFDIDGEQVTSDEMMDLASERVLNAMHTCPFNVIILHFDSELEAVNHYIAINENVTHSKEDIDRAIRYRDKLIAENNK